MPLSRNAYVVSVDPTSAPAFAAFVVSDEIRASFPLHAWFKFSSELRLADAGAASHGSAGRDVVGRFDAIAVARAARDPSAVSITPWANPVPLDEIAGQILAENLDASLDQPTVPGYSAWLASKGFQASGQLDFVVDVTDSGFDRGSVTDVRNEFRVGGLATGANRLVYSWNRSIEPSAQDFELPTFDAQGVFQSVPFTLPLPALGANVALQAVYVDATGPLGTRLTWAPNPFTL